MKKVCKLIKLIENIKDVLSKVCNERNETNNKLTITNIKTKKPATKKFCLRKIINWIRIFFNLVKRQLNKYETKNSNNFSQCF